MIEEALLNYGMAGIFILYLIFDRQVLLKGIQDSLEKNTTATLEMIEYLKR